LPKDFIIKQLKERFGGQLTISREELFGFYKAIDPDLNDSTFGWRIYTLREKNLLSSVGRGLYTLAVKQPFHPEVDDRQKELAGKIVKQFPLARHCTWTTKWISEWTTHQPGRFLILAEVEASAVESVFYFLKDNNYRDVYLNPDETLLNRYVYEDQDAIVVKTLVSKAPLKKEKQIFLPAIEKILVDLFIDRHLFAPFQGNELVTIFNNVYKAYVLNISRLLAYARRRNREQQLLDYITRNTIFKEFIKE
jgi:hypothetical protein